MAFILGRSIKSPDQVAADAAAPEYSTVLAQVESRVLQETLQLSGSAGFESGSQVLAAEVAGAGRLVVSSVGVEAGEEAQNGQMLVAVSERPVFLLEGESFAYRDMRPGLDGDDISQLQAALKSLGYQVDITGHYGSSTAAAVEVFYEDRGYEALRAGDHEALDAATKAVEDAERVHDSAEASLRGAEVAEPRDNEAIAGAEAALIDAEAGLDSAEETLADLKATSGAVLPLSEVVFAKELPVKVNSVSATKNDVVVVGDLLMSLAQGNLGVHAEVNPVDAEKIEPGMQVLLSGNGEEIEGTVSAIEQPKAVEGQEETLLPVLHVEAEVPEAWAGTEVWLSVVLSTTEAEVMAVPQTAVYTSSDGTTSVLRQNGDGSEKIVVELGATGNGYIEVISAEVQIGDYVVVGQR
ncbi:peptidoglycan-binding protein [Glycomyces sp. NPDC046736]|uniref:peptidoglycan-binding protein n=1 Tax=Glycomyces sp. NPDC046736 TaxID=3155615 RepID=UPI0033E65256